jgi:GH24 family phage-related lysozyme (muramidase)
MPFDNTYVPKDMQWEPENAKAIPANKYLNYSAKVDICCWDKMNKAVKDCIYLVSFSFNTGVKTLKLNFTGNFKYFDAWGYKDDKNFTVTRKIAWISY